MKQIIRNVVSTGLMVVLATVSVAEARGGGRGGREVRSVSRSDVNVNRNRNTNVNVNRDVNVNVHNDYHGGYGYGGCCYHPVATAAAVTAPAMAAPFLVCEPAGFSLAVTMTVMSVRATWLAPSNAAR